MSKKDFQIFLYKNKLNNSTLVDILDNLSNKTIAYLQKDLENKKITLSNDTETNTIYIFTDGSCKNNGKKGAKGGYGVFFTDNTELPFCKLNCVHTLNEEPTNQKAELLGIHKTFQILHANKDLFLNVQKIIIATDSMYSIKCIKDWSKTWLKNNWKTSKGEIVKNNNIIKEILDMQEFFLNKIEYKHIFSHLSEPKNKDTIEYILWKGNDTIDKMINIELSK